MSLLIRIVAIIVGGWSLISMISDVVLRFGWTETKGIWVGYKEHPLKAMNSSSETSTEFTVQTFQDKQALLSQEDDETAVDKCFGNIFEYIIDDKKYTGYTLSDLKMYQSRKPHKPVKIIANPENLSECIICKRLYLTYVKDSLYLLLALLTPYIF